MDPVVTLYLRHDRRFVSYPLSIFVYPSNTSGERFRYHEELACGNYYQLGLYIAYRWHALLFSGFT